MAAEEWRRVALVGGTGTAAEKDTSQKAHCIDAGSRNQQVELRQRVRGFLRLCSREWRTAEPGKLAAEKQAKIENAISRFMTESQTPGVSAAVVEDGELVWSAGFGMADLENSVPGHPTRCTAWSIRNRSRQLPPWRCGNTAV